MSANQPTPEHVALARWLLGHEAKQGGDATPAARVYDKLLTQVTPLLGAAGAEMLFVRSAKLTGDGFHVLASVPLLDGEPSLRATLHSADPAVATESATNLFATFLLLMTTFIGERLTAQVLRRAWPMIEARAGENQ